jgi:hypothetical protein
MEEVKMVAVKGESYLVGAVITVECDGWGLFNPDEITSHEARCKNRIQFNHRSVQEVRRRLKASGWQFWFGRDLCPVCDVWPGRIYDKDYMNTRKREMKAELERVMV